MSPHHTMACTDVGGRVTDGAGSSVAAEWSDRARTVTLSPLAIGLVRLRVLTWVALATANGQAFECERREEEKGRARGYRGITFAHRARNDLCDQCGQGGLVFLALVGPAVRLLGDLAPRWPAGSPAQSVAEAPDVDLRRTARSRHQAKPGVPSCSRVKRDSAAPSIKFSRGKSQYEKAVLLPGLSYVGVTQPRKRNVFFRNNFLPWNFL